MGVDFVCVKFIGDVTLKNISPSKYFNYCQLTDITDVSAEPRRYIEMCTRRYNEQK